jgi:hypothetical protein
MYGVSVCTTCMSVHSSHRRHALSFLFIDLGLKILKPKIDLNSVSTDPSINYQSQNSTTLCSLLVVYARRSSCANCHLQAKNEGTLCTACIPERYCKWTREWVVRSAPH